MQAVIAAIDAGAGPGTLEICTAAFAAVLAVIPLSDPSFTEAGGVITMAGVPKSDAAADATGTAAVARIKDSNAVVVVNNLTVGVGSGDIQLNSTAINAGPNRHDHVGHHHARAVSDMGKAPRDPLSLKGRKRRVHILAPIAVGSLLFGATLIDTHVERGQQRRETIFYSLEDHGRQIRDILSVSLSYIIASVGSSNFIVPSDISSNNWVGCIGGGGGGKGTPGGGGGGGAFSRNDNVPMTASASLPLHRRRGRRDSGGGR